MLFAFPFFIRDKDYTHLRDNLFLFFDRIYKMWADISIKAVSPPQFLPPGRFQGKHFEGVVGVGN